MNLLPWEPNAEYGPGSSCVYKGRVYRTIQPHRSQVGWTPEVTPALWAVGEFVEPTGNATQPPPPPDYYTQFPQEVKFPDGPVQTPQYGADAKYGSDAKLPEGAMPSVIPGSHSDSKDLSFNTGLNIGSHQQVQQPSYSGYSPALVRYRSSQEWINDARRRADDFAQRGPREPLVWLLAMPGQIPPGAIKVGVEADGSPLFAARNFHEGGLHLGWANHQGAAISYGGRQIPLTTYEVLTGDGGAVHWVPASSPGDARPVEAGFEGDGKSLYIAQIKGANSRVLPGKCSSWTSGAWVASEGQEWFITPYNVLVHK